MQGIVFQELNRPLDENEERTFKVNGLFSDFTYWNYDRDPSENDMIRQALQWVDFAKAVCVPTLHAESYLTNLKYLLLL